MPCLGTEKTHSYSIKATYTQEIVLLRNAINSKKKKSVNKAALF